MRTREQEGERKGRGGRGEEQRGWAKERVGLGCCSDEGTGREGGREAPVMKSAIRIPSSNLQPNLYISRYTLV